MKRFKKGIILISAMISAFGAYAEGNSKINNSYANASSCIVVPARATTLVKMRVNLAASDISPSIPFNPADSHSWNYHLSTMIYDASGYSYKLTLYFVKEEVNKWVANVYVNGKAIGIGEFKFDASGNLVNLTGLDNLKWTPTALAEQVFSIDPTCTTQLGSTYNCDPIWNDGVPGSASFHAILTSQHFTKKQGTTTNNSCIIMPARATSLVMLHDNLNSSDCIPTTTDFNPIDLTSYNFVHFISVYDSLGIQHELNIYYCKNAANHWTMYVYVDNNQIGIGKLEFNGTGALVSVTGLNDLMFFPSTGAVSPQLFSINMTCSTQYGMQDAVVETAWQDGHTYGPMMYLN